MKQIGFRQGLYTNDDDDGYGYDYDDGVIEYIQSIVYAQVRLVTLVVVTDEVAAASAPAQPGSGLPRIQCLSQKAGNACTR